MMGRVRLFVLLVATIGLFAALAAACDSAGDGSASGADTAIAVDVGGGDVGSSADVVAEDAVADGASAPAVVDPHMEQRGEFTIVWLAGTPLEMGQQQGELLHDVIADAMTFVEGDMLLSSFPKVAEDMGIVDILAARTFPEIVEECEGLVDTAGDTGFDMRMCLVLNTGDALLHFIQYGVPADADAGPGCSGVIAAGDATADGRLYHTRNLDWGGMNIDIIYHHPTIFVRQPTGGVPHVVIGFPMNLSAYTGMNDAGISLGTHAADPVDASELSALGRSNVQVSAHLLATARSLAEVEAFVTSEPRMTTGILVAADGPGGDGAVFEVSPSGVGVRRLGDEGLAYATNHFVSDVMKDKDDATPGEGTLRRWDRFGQLLDPDGAETHYGALSPAELAVVMRDTKNAWTGETPTLDELEAMDWDEDGSLGCNASMHFAIFDPERGLFWLIAGAPPLYTKHYTCFSLGALLGRDDAPACEPATLD